MTNDTDGIWAREARGHSGEWRGMQINGRPDPTDPAYITVRHEVGQRQRAIGKRLLKWSAFDALAIVVAALIMAITGVNMVPIGAALILFLLVLLLIAGGLIATGVGMAWRERHPYAKRKASE